MFLRRPSIIGETSGSTYLMYKLQVDQRKTLVRLGSHQENVTLPFFEFDVARLMLALVGMFSVLGYRYIGGYGWLDAVWMVVITVSTVGYSEQSEQTACNAIAVHCRNFVGRVCQYLCHRWIHSIAARRRSRPRIREKKNDKRYRPAPRSRHHLRIWKTWK